QTKSVLSLVQVSGTYSPGVQEVVSSSDWNAARSQPHSRAAKLPSSGFAGSGHGAAGSSKAGMMIGSSVGVLLPRFCSGSSPSGFTVTRSVYSPGSTSVMSSQRQSPAPPSTLALGS